MSFISADTIYFLNIVIFFLLVSIGTFYLALLSREYLNIKQQKNDLALKQDKLLLGIEQQVQQIVANTAKETKKILSMAVSGKNQLASSFEVESEKLQLVHRSNLEEMMKQQLTTSAKMFKDLEISLNSRGQQWLKTREKTLDRILEKFEKKMADEYQSQVSAIEKDIHRYKESQIDIVKKQTKVLFDNLTKDILRKYLSPSDLEHLLDESLTKFVDDYGK